MNTPRSQRLATLAALIALLLLAACGGAAQEQAASVDLAETSLLDAAAVSGIIAKLDRSALPPNAVVEVELVDASRADAPATVLVAQSLPTDGAQTPLPFELGYDPATIDPAALILVQARILVDGQLQYITQTATPVITRGAPTSGVEVIVSPVATGQAGGALTGTVSYLERIALDPAAVIAVELQDVSSGQPVVVAQAEVPAEGRQVPIPFELAYDPATIDPANTYLLYGRILQGGVAVFATQAGVPVLTGGAPTGSVELLLSPVAATTGTMLRGTVTTPRPPGALEPGAVLTVELREPMLADAPAVATVQVPLDGLNFPVSFELPYDPATIAADRSYVVGARVVAGNRLLYTSLSPVPALTGGAPGDTFIVPVAPVPDPSGGVVSFTVNSDTPMTWAADSTAVLNVEIREPMLADAPAMAFAYVPLAGLSFPVAFEIGYDAALVDPNKAYVLDARIVENNALTFASTAPVQVLTQGAPLTDAALTLVAQEGTGGTGGNQGLITGVITTDAPVALDPAAMYFIDFREAGTTGDPIVTISGMANGQFPIPFEVPYVPEQIDPAKQYVLGARVMVGDQVLYASAVGVPVVTLGAPATDVVVNIPAQ